MIINHYISKVFQYSYFLGYAISCKYQKDEKLSDIGLGLIE